MRDKKTMNRAVFPGSFDPVTVGHMDLIVRSAKMFDEVIVGVLRNAAKQPLCTVAERVSLLQELTAEIPGVRIEAFDGLLIDFVDKMDACAVIRGLRTAADFEYSYISSSGVKEIIQFGGDITGLVPPSVQQFLLDRNTDNR